MSALRLNYPGQPVVLVELGPARGRVTGPQISGGSMWDGIPAIKPRTIKPPVPRRGPAFKTWVRCGAPMHTGEPCGRRVDHGRNHMSKAAVDHDSARRRTSKGYAP